MAKVKELHMLEAEWLQAQLKARYGFDPISILLLISLAVSIIRMIQGCRKKAKDVKASTSFDDSRAAVKKVVYRRLGIWKYKYVGPITDLILQRASEHSNVSLQKLIDSNLPEA